MSPSCSSTASACRSVWRLTENCAASSCSHGSFRWPSAYHCGSVCRSAITSCSYFGAIRTRLLSRILEACSKNASTYTFVVGGRCPHRPLQPNVRMPANSPTIYAKFAAFCCRGCVRFHCTTAIRKPHCRICLFSFGDLSDSRKKFCAFADNTRKTEKVLRNFQTITEKIKQALHRT